MGTARGMQPVAGGSARLGKDQHVARDFAQGQLLGRGWVPAAEGHADAIFQQDASVARIVFAALIEGLGKRRMSLGLTTANSMSSAAARNIARSRLYTPVASSVTRIPAPVRPSQVNKRRWPAALLGKLWRGRSRPAERKATTSSAALTSIPQKFILSTPMLMG